MHILLVTDSYPPEIRSASHLMLELAEELYQRGHRVTVATTWPRYNLDLSEKQYRYSEFMNEHGIEVLRFKTLRHHNVNYIYRGIAQLLMPVYFLRKFHKYHISLPDVVLVYSPPLPLALVGAYLRRKSVKFILNVQDIFPQNAIDLGALTNPIAIRLFRYIERKVYRAADVITTHSDGNRILLQKQHPRLKDKFTTLHNWVDLAHFKKKFLKDFRAIYNIPDKFIAVFAGVIGPSQDLDLLLNAAENLKDCSNLLILIVGDGSDKKLLQKRAEEMGLSNVMFQPFVGRDDYPALLDACNIGIVSLSPKNKTPVVPGKLLGYMAAGLPVVALLNRESDGHYLIMDSGCGYSAPSDNPDTVLTVLRKAYENREQLSAMGTLGYRYVSRYFSKELCVSALENMITETPMLSEKASASIG